MRSYDLTEDQQKLLRMLVTLSRSGELPKEFLVLKFKNPKKSNSSICQVQLTAGRTHEFDSKTDLDQLCEHDPPLVHRINNLYSITQPGFDAVDRNFQFAMFDHLLLEQGQKDLLRSLVEASRNVAPDQRRKFAFYNYANFSRASLSHPGLPGKKLDGVYEGDLETLDREGLIAIAPQGRHHGLQFDVTPKGFKYYEEMMYQVTGSVQWVETTLIQYLNSRRFSEAYPQAHQKWTEAENLLWSSDSDKKFTTIGHLCREALQEFAEALIDLHKPPDVDSDKTHTVARLRSVLALRANQLGSTEKPFLDALVTYWGTVSDLVQRQEHGALKEGESLVWEDGRRITFHTAVVMFEVDRSVSRTL